MAALPPANLVDSKRGYTVEIALAQFRPLGPPDAVWLALLRDGIQLQALEAREEGGGVAGGVEDEVREKEKESEGGRGRFSFTQTNVEAVLSILPTEDEARACAGWPEERLGALSVAELWFRASARVPRPLPKMRACLLAHTLDAQAAEVSASCRTVCAAVQQVRSCEALRDLLALTLTVGNAMNASAAPSSSSSSSSSSSASSVAAFRLESLGALARTKANDNKTTLLDYIAAAAVARWGERVLQLSAALPAIAGARRIVLSECAADARKLANGLLAAQTELAAVRRDLQDAAPQSPTLARLRDASRSFHDGLAAFVAYAQDVVASVDAALRDAQAAAAALAEHFAEDPATQPDAIFTTLHNFAQELSTVAAKLARKAKSAAAVPPAAAPRP
jgi:Formin Homology 2 Domain